MSKNLSYRPHLDGLRALAVLVVLSSHWLRDAGISDYFIHGRYGVDLFFVLSGFLLTSILLKQKNQGLSTFKAIKGFFVKRALRLFPAFFLMLFGLLAIDHFTNFWLWSEGNGIYYFTYTANFLFFFEGHQNPSLNHLWSLCVEEQFYLFLPWLILLFTRRTNAVLFSLLIGISLISMSVFDGIHRVMLHGNLSTLGLGVLLAYFYEPVKSLLENSVLRRSLILGFLLLSLLTSLIWPTPLHELFVGAFFALIVASANMNLDTSPWTLLDNRSLIFIGKISYGLYLFHRPIPHLLNATLLRLNLEFSPYLLMFTYCVLLLIITLFSYYFIERPFMKLKSRFDY
jgi:peptidoglycan/LPS O-acetylase OafA/YrhL